MARFLSHHACRTPAAERFVTAKMQIAPQGLNNYSGGMTSNKCVMRRTRKTLTTLHCKPLKLQGIHW